MKNLFIYCSLLVATLICTDSLAQQYRKGKLVLADGKEVEALIQPPSGFNTSQINYKISEDGEKQSYKSPLLKSIIIYGEGENYQFDWGTYLELLSFGKIKESKPHWLIVLIKGPATLYTVGQKIQFKKDRMVYSNTSSIPYYAQRDGEKYASSIGFYMPATAGLDADFRTQSAKYFNDYPELVKRIEAKEFVLKDVVQVVEIYNKWASAKSKKVKGKK
jgi:hypothetical protein